MSRMDEKTGISTAADLHEPAHASPTGAHAPAHGAPEIVNGNGMQISDAEPPPRTVEEIQQSKKGRFAYFKTKDFYIVLVLG